MTSRFWITFYRKSVYFLGFGRCPYEYKVLRSKNNGDKKMEGGKQFTLLLWKNWVLQKRHPVATVVQILLPGLFAMILMFTRLAVDVVPSVNATNFWPVPVLECPFPHSFPNITEVPDFPEGIFNGTFNISNINVEVLRNLTLALQDFNYNVSIVYAPNVAAVQDVMAILGKRMGERLDAKGFETEDDLEYFMMYDARKDYYAGAVVFQGITKGSFPEVVKYKIRLKTERIGSEYGIDSLWYTNSLYPDYQSAGPRNWNNRDGAPDYCERGFLRLQHAISDCLIEYFTGSKPLLEQMSRRVFIHKMNYPPFTKDDYIIVLQYWLPLVLLLSFLYPVISIAKSMVLEKERKLKESMKIMGLSAWLHWAAWYVKSLIMLLLNTLLITMLLTISINGQGVSAITYTNIFLLFVFIFLYVLSTIAFAFLLSAIFSKANSAAAFTSLIWFLMIIPYYIIFPRYSTVSFGAKIISCFLCNTCMSLGAMIIAKYEAISYGMQWDVLNIPSTPDDDLTLALIFAMFVADTAIYILLALYLDAVFPGDFGLPKPWYFPFTKRFWCSDSDRDKITMQLPNTKQDECPELFESDPSDIEAGIKIRGLTKVFAKTKIAVNNLNLNMFENHITVLLGHNGAGKSTTMAMLTGLYPPSRGTAFINDFDVRTNIHKVRRSLGLCPQHDVLFDDLTVEEHLYFFCKLKGCKKSAVKGEIEKMLAATDLVNKKKNLAQELSGGMRRRLSVGIALVGGSKVVMLDEPTSGMDPAARRFTWDLLQSESQRRTILLTTHFMDEADVLGDRIAIMAHGELQCSGTPMFLKKKYGAGYHMVLVKNANCNVEKVTEVVKSYLPTAEVESNIGAELAFILPHEESPSFPKLFSHFEENKEKLGISSFGASVTTMEEVFLRVGEQSDSTLKAVLQRGNTEKAPNNGSAKLVDNGRIGEERISISTDTDIMATIEGVPKNRGYKLYTQQFWAMLVKKAIHTKRNWPIMLAQLVFPLIIMILVLIVIKTLPNFDSPPPYVLNLEKYKGTFVAYYNDASAHFQPVVAEYQSQFNEEYDKPVPVDPNTYPNISDYLLEKAEDNIKKFNLKYIIAADFSTAIGGVVDTVTAWFNGQPFHSPAISLAAVDNALMRSATNKAHSIQVTNHPLKRSIESQATVGGSATVVGFQIGFNIVFGYALLASSFVIFLVKERSTNAKHLQFVSGVHSFTFWLSTFLWDFINYMLTCIAILILFQIFQLDGYTSAVMQGRILVIFIMFGWSVLPLMYLCSFAFKVPSTAFTRLVVINVVFGMATMLTYNILIIPVLELEHIANILDWIFVFIPSYSLGIAFYELHNNWYNSDICTQNFVVATCKLDPTFSCCKGTCVRGCLNYEDNYFAWTRPGIGKMIAFMGLTGFVFFTILFLFETSYWQQFVNFIYNIRRRYFKKKVKVGQMDVDVEDDDVLRERYRILNTPLSKLFESETLIMRDITKYYGNFLAVDHLSVGVPRGECFGLLGINGAGKTTTFKMLTGDETISEGDAFMEMFSSRTQIKEVQQKIGYCPQFDAFIEQMTGRETLTMFARLRGVQERHIGQMVDALSKKLLFTEHIDKEIKNYSGGNKRKLSTAVALVGDPPIIFLDEPTTGMDPLARRVVWDTVSKIRDSGRSIIYTSHSMEECDVLCTRIAIMVNGQFKCLGSPQHLKSKFGQGYTLLAKIAVAETARLQPHLAEENLRKLKSFIEAMLPGSILKDSHQGMVHYHVVNPSLSWSKIFSILEEAKAKYNVEDYSVGQTTLEQVFLSFTKAQVNADES